MFLKPVEGRSVPDPERGGRLAPEGRNVDPTNYWLRRLADGDVVESADADEPATAESTAPRRSKKEEA